VRGIKRALQFQPLPVSRAERDAGSGEFEPVRGIFSEWLFSFDQSGGRPRARGDPYAAASQFLRGGLAMTLTIEGG
jgi:hypothetical protein